MSFLKWGHIFTNMAGMEKMINTKPKDQWGSIFECIRITPIEDLL
jgi:hypothetical protein